MRIMFTEENVSVPRLTEAEIETTNPAEERGDTQAHHERVRTRTTRQLLTPTRGKKCRRSVHMVTWSQENTMANLWLKLK